MLHVLPVRRLCDLKIIVFSLLFVILFTTGTGITTTSVYAEPEIIFVKHTTQGAKYWMNWCKSSIGQMLVSEDCLDLVSKHDQLGHGLSEEGWRVAKCLAGGALAATNPELIPELAVAAKTFNIKCGGNSYSNNNDIVGNLLSGIFGR